MGRRSSPRCSRAGEAAGLYSHRGRRGAARARLAGPRARERAFGRPAMTDAVRSFMDKKAVAQVLEQIAAFLELKGENPFRIRAFRTAAARRRRLSGRSARRDSTTAAWPPPRASGPATLQIVRRDRHHRPGEHARGAARADPARAWSRCSPSQGLGVAKIRQIHEVLDIDSLPELEAAALDGRLARLPRFGPKTSENILKGIAYLRQASAFRLLHHAADEAEGLRAALERMPGVLQVVVAGDVRRRAEVVRDLVLVIVADVPPGELFKRLSQLPGVHEFAGQDDRRLTLRFAGGASAQIVVTTPVNTGAVLVQATGSEAHLRAARRARRLARSRPERRRALAGQRVRPHARRGRVLCGARPRLHSARAARGPGRDRGRRAPRAARACSSAATCAAFSTATRATPTARTRSRSSRCACRAAGYEYVGITDHSQAAAYAGGLKAGRPRAPGGRDRRGERAARRASGCSRGSRPTSCRTAGSTSTRRCSPGSIS